MPAGSSGRRRRGARAELNYWPAFVDALSTLLLAIVFLISVFMVGQFFLSRELSSRDTVLDRLNRQISELTDLLSLERSSRRTLEENLDSLQSTLQSAEADRERLKNLVEQRRRRPEPRRRTEPGPDDRTAGQRPSHEPDRCPEPADRRHAAPVRGPRGGSRTRPNPATRTARPGSPISARRLNVALAQRVQELARFRSDFFGRLRQILGSRQDVRIVGDRFVFQSEVLFPAGQANLKPEASGELDRIASALVELEKQIPPDIPWVIRVDGHTDARPIATPQFPSNWALSAARAIAVVQAFAARGVSPQHLLAAGFGEYQPLDLGTSEEAYARNRRIELKLTER